MQQQNTQKVEASKVPEYIKKAAKKAAEFNSNLNRERLFHKNHLHAVN